MTDRTDLPSPTAANFSQRSRETMMTYLGRQGDPLDRGVTLRDLIDSGITQLASGVSLKSLGAGAIPFDAGSKLSTVIDLSPPPTPTGFTVTAGITFIFIEIPKQTYTEGGGHYRTHVYGAKVSSLLPTPTFLDSVEVCQFTGEVVSLPSEPSTEWAIWLKYETLVNVLSADAGGGTNGVHATTGLDVSRLVSAMTGASNPFQVVPIAITLSDGTVVPAGTYTSDAYIKNGSIATAKIGDAAITNAKIANLSAEKINAGYLSADRIQAVSITADKIGGGQISASETITVGGAGSGAPLVLSGNGEIISNGSNGAKARFYFGNVEIYKNVPNVGSVVYKALSRSETGVGQNNVQVTISGYFTSQPKIIVSPANIKLYDAAYSNQSQSIQCEAQNISESSAGSMVWRFTPKATLSLAANTGQTVINESSGSISSGWTSSQYTTAANTSAVTLNVTLRSYRGTGTSGNYYYRTARWKAQYWNGSTWVDSAWSTTNFGADTAANVTTSITITFPSAGAWLVRAVTEAYDTNGTTFNTGTSYEYATDNVSRSDYKTVTANAPPGETLSLDYTPSYSLPSGWSVVSSSFTYSYTSSISYYRFGGASISGGNGYFPVQTNYSGSATYTDGLSLSFVVRATLGSFGDGGYAQLNVSGLTGTISRRRALTNSTIAVNSFSLNYYNFSLTSSQVLADGSLNWVAFGD